MLVGDRGPESRQWYTNSSERRVFMCASELALHENLSHRHMAVYHRGRSPSASTSESHGGVCDHMSDQKLLGAPL
ncbi:hypothetical protein BHE74_00044786 [Ensete ventricosum]|nr:hypothetical protein BHE74_00044786 [Ensete ventricosum]RZR84662.1 hypothetical protein BHM03_00011526 [Ensete ventricosum]